MTTLKGRTGPGTWVRVAQTSVTDFVKKVGDTMTGPLKVQTLHVGNVWGSPGYDGIQSETNAAGSAGGGAAVLLPRTGMTPNSFLVGGVGGGVRLRGDSTATTGSYDVTVDATGHMVVPGYTLGTEALASGWTAGSIVIMQRAGWVFLKIYGLKKTSAPATGERMFTIPDGFRQHSSIGTIFFPLIANSGIGSGGVDGLKSYMASFPYADGIVEVAGSYAPAANVNLYGTVTYPVA